MTTKYREAGDLAREALVIQDVPIGGIFLVSGTNEDVYDDAPFKFKVLFAWAVAIDVTGDADAKWTDGTSDITDGMDCAGTDKKVDICATIDDAKYEIAVGDTLHAATDAHARVYALCQRTA